VLVADREYVAADGTVDIERAVQKALARASGRPDRHAGFLAEPASTVRRTWLDTFDWRLYRAGFVLQRVERSRTTPTLRLTLIPGDDVLTVAAPAQVQTAARVAYPLDTVVPAGPMRSLLEPVVEMRALQPVATQRFVVRSYRVLNDDEKTVARVVIEHPSGAGAGASSASSRVSVVASRGYSDEAAATARIIAKVPGLTPSHQSTLAQALSATGRSPGDYSSKLDIALSRGMPTEYAVRRIMRALLDAAQRNVPGVVAGTDTEFLHDLRVAVRRARSTLKVTGDALPAAQADAASVALKWLGDLTTPTRDLDVYLLGLDELAAEVTAPGWSASQLSPFRDFLIAAQASEQTALVRSLRSVRAKRAFAAWAAVSTGADLPAEDLDAPEKTAVSRVESVAKSAVTRAFKRVIKAGNTITPESPPSDLHDLRKRCKELRYSLEIFGSLHNAIAQRALIDDLKKLQDCLGEFQDTEVQQHAIRTFAAQMLAADSSNTAIVEAVMAMGRLADRLGERQVVARGTFAVLFERFAGPQPRAHLAALYERAS
jgi:CHAD domain-containing protein